MKYKKNIKINNIIEKTVNILKSGGVILYPTDTIWGIGCDATNIDAVKKIYNIKERKLDKSIILLVENEAHLRKFVDISDLALNMININEKPMTFIYDSPRGLPKDILAEDKSIGIRIVKHDFCKKVISELGKPITSTSANLHGEKSPMKFSDIHPKILKSVDYVVEGFNDEISKYGESSIIKIEQNNVIKIIRK